MYDVFNVIASNLGVSFSQLVIIVAACIGLIPYAKDAKIGVLFNLVIFGAIFVWFVQEGLSWDLPALIMMAHLVILSLTIYGTSRENLIA